MTDDDLNEYGDQEDDFPRRAEEIHAHELTQTLTNLTLIGTDPYLSMQAWNIALIDKWLLDREAEFAPNMIGDDRIGIDLLSFMNAQSQMWMFALFELLRTWRARAKDVIKWAENGGLPAKIEHLLSKNGLRHDPHHEYARQLQAIVDNSSIVDSVRDDIARTHVVLTRLEFLRVALAKHEVRSSKLLADAPGYARIDLWTGSMSYQIGAGRIVLDTVTRRSFGDGLRALNNYPSVPDVADLTSFDEFMSLKGIDPYDDPFASD